MLAAASFVAWWQIVLFVMFLGTWVGGGGALLWVGGRFVAKLERLTFARCVGVNVVAAIAGGAAMKVVGLSSLVLGAFGVVLGGLAGMLAAWCVIAAMLKTSFGKAALAWLVTIPSGIVSVALLVSIFLPTLGQARELARRRVCVENLGAVAKGLKTYADGHGGTPPESLQSLVETKAVSAEALKCLSAPPGQAGHYFYLPAQPPTTTTRPAAADRIIACDFPENHQRQGRNCLYADGQVRWLDEPAFQGLLLKSENTAFAEALTKAEKD